MPSKVKRLRPLEDGTSKLKRIMADLSLDKAMLEDVLSQKLSGLSAGVGGGRVEGGLVFISASSRSRSA